MQPKMKPADADILNPTLVLVGKLLPMLSTAHVENDVGPWMLSSVHALRGVKVLPSPPGWSFRKLEGILHQKKLKIDTTMVASVLSFHDELGKLSKATVAIKTGEMKPGDSCTLLSHWMDQCHLDVFSAILCF
jgi:hypothetical protein